MPQISSVAIAPHPTRVRRSLLALVAALALLVAGLAVPARAADPLDITGRVVFPAGYTYSAATPPQLEVRYPTGFGTTEAVRYPVLYVTVAADGSFTVPGSRLTSTRQYYLVLGDGQQRLLGGYVTASGGVAQQHPAGALYTPGRTGIVETATIGAQITGRVVLPSGFTADASRPLSVYATIGTPYADSERWAYGRIAADGTFTVGGFPSGQAVRLSITDPQDVLFDGAWNPSDGFFSGNRDRVGTVTAPAGGLTLRPNLAGAISGRVIAPAAYLDNSYVPVEAVVDATGAREGASSASVAGDGSFTIPDLDTGRSYALAITNGPSDMPAGALHEDGSWSATSRSDPAFAATWPDLKKVRPATGDVELRPTIEPGVRGFVTTPDDFRFGYWDEHPAQVQLWARGVDGAWTKVTWWPVSDSAWFSIRSSSSADRSQDHLLWFESNGSKNPKNARFPSGFWTGNDSPLTTDPDKATVIRHTAGVDYVIPLAVQNLTAPSVTGTVRVGSTLKVSTGTWDPASVTTRVQWLRDGKVISGATSSSYTLKAADGGARVSVRVTASGGAGWLPTSVTSAQVSVPVPVRNVTRASISGTVAFGRTVRVQRGQWSPEPVSTSVQWLRDGVAIAGATSSSYTVVKADIGTRLSVRVVARGADGSQATSTSVSTKVAKVVPSVRVSAPSVKAGSQVKVTVQVDAGGVLSRPLGTVRVTVGSSTKTVTLKSSHVGKVTVTFAARAKGSYKVSATYTPTSSSATYLTGGTSSTVTLKVT